MSKAGDELVAAEAVKLSAARESLRAYLRSYVLSCRIYAETTIQPISNQQIRVDVQGLLSDELAP